MTIPDKAAVLLERPRRINGAVPTARVSGGAAPALYRLLADSALNRAALDVCAAPVGIIDAVATGYPVVYVNPAFDALFGCSAGEALGKPARAILATDTEVLLDWLPWGGAQARIALETRRRSDGVALTLDAFAGDIRNARGERTHWVLTLMDAQRC